jgi:hypothetical protein
MRDPKVMRMISMSQSRLVRYVFNYNVLEAVSIAVATTILLAGMVRVLCCVVSCMGCRLACPVTPLC